MKSKKFLQYFFFGALFIFATHIILVYFNFFKIDFNAILKLDSIVFFVFAVGAFFIATALRKNGESFVNRFLVLTTFQMLAMMVVLLALVYVKFPDFKTVAFHTISLFSTLLILQSIFLIRSVNSLS